MGYRKIYVTIKGKFSATIEETKVLGAIAGRTKAHAVFRRQPQYISVLVKDNSGETILETLEQENKNIKLGKERISGDTILKLAICLDEDMEVAKIVKGLSFFVEDSNPKSKRVMHGISLIDDFDFKMTGYEITDSK